MQQPHRTTLRTPNPPRPAPPRSITAHPPANPANPIPGIATIVEAACEYRCIYTELPPAPSLLTAMHPCLSSLSQPHPPSSLLRPAQTLLLLLLRLHRCNCTYRYME